MKLRLEEFVRNPLDDYGWHIDPKLLREIKEECEKVDPDYTPSMEQIETVLRALPNVKSLKEDNINEIISMNNHG